MPYNYLLLSKTAGARGAEKSRTLIYPEAGLSETEKRVAEALLPLLKYAWARHAGIKYCRQVIELVFK